MLPSLGFDTLVVNNRQYDDKNLCLLFDIFCKRGIKSFIFLIDFDLEKNSLSIENQKMSEFKKLVSNIAPRGMSIKVFYNISVAGGFSLNKDLQRLFAIKKQRSLFAELPLFTDNCFDSIAYDINNLIYRKKTFIVFTSFDAVINTASDEFSRKLIANNKIGFSLDINYMLDPDNTPLLLDLVESRAMILPAISHDLSNYVGVLDSADFFAEKMGKKKYYQMISHINKCASKFDC